ncbi:hypothetical protein Clacol_003620 [Clathrus columnatus]|uniref:Ribosome maturation protein SBDS n=1 Tax=Clathrus columnatus TaxID=1419009 RepID=A0AAV5A871_9AGAM|nr:hypothetical protein Clacol_003620 [Clathrus columnatus]
MIVKQKMVQRKKGRLTNVSIVRLKKGGKRFELHTKVITIIWDKKIACYKNKVQEWRRGIETSLDDVLQINNVFINVSKGEVAKANDLQKAFNTSDINKIVKEILSKGEVQVGDKERAHDLNNLWREIATQVAEKCVDPETQRPYSVGIIEKAMTEAGFSIRQGKNAKSQVEMQERSSLTTLNFLKVLDCIKLLQTGSTLPIQRARMRIKITIPVADKDQLKGSILQSADKVESENQDDQNWIAVLLIDPGQFRVLNDLLQKEIKNRGHIETLTLAATTTTAAST